MNSSIWLQVSSSAVSSRTGVRQLQLERDLRAVGCGRIVFRRSGRIARRDVSPGGDIAWVPIRSHRNVVGDEVRWWLRNATRRRLLPACVE